MLYVGCLKVAPLRSCVLQAVLFLTSGVIVMFGCMSLIILDWIHNATAATQGHGEGH